MLLEGSRIYMQIYYGRDTVQTGQETARAGEESLNGTITESACSCRRASLYPFTPLLSVFPFS